MALLRFFMPSALAALALAPAVQAETPAQRCASRAHLGDHRACARAMRAKPADPGIRRLFAISLHKAGLYHASIEQYGKVVRMRPDDYRASYEYGSMLAFVRRYQEAIPPLERAAALRPAAVDVYRALAIAYIMAKRKSDAFRAALRGAALGDPVSMFDVAESFREGTGVKADPAKAVAWLARAARAGHVMAMDRLVQVYLNGEMGQRADDARAEFWAKKSHDARR